MFDSEFFPREQLAGICTVFQDGDWIESKDQDENGSIRLIQTGNIGSGVYLDKPAHSKFVNEDTFVKLKCSEVLSGDVLFSRLPDPVGRACLVPEDTGRMITAVDCTIARLDSSCLSSFLIGFTQTLDYESQIESHITGTTRKRISRKNLGKVAIPISPISLQQEYSRLIEQVGKSKFAIQKNTINSVNSLGCLLPSCINLSAI